MKIGDIVQRKKSPLGRRQRFIVLNRLSYEEAGGLCGIGSSFMEHLVFWELLNEDGNTELCLDAPEFARHFTVISKGQE